MVANQRGAQALKKRVEPSKKPNIVRNQRKCNIVLNKKLGQHLLKNDGVLDQIIAACSLRSTDTVLEIGPGTGNLTMRVLPLVRRVMALDVDERMVGEVRKRALSQGYTNLSVRHGDALKSELGQFDVCVANLPYQISSPFVFKLIAHRPKFRVAVLMFQKEFAARLLAKPHDKNYSRLSVNTQLFCNVDRVCAVSACSFIPPPQVDSMVVKLTPKCKCTEVDFHQWDGLLRLCFTRKRKTLHAVLTTNSVLKLLDNNRHTVSAPHSIHDPILPIKSVVEEILTETSMSEKRAVNLGLDDFLKLLLEFNKKHIHFRNVKTELTQSMDESP